MKMIVGHTPFVRLQKLYAEEATRYLLKPSLKKDFLYWKPDHAEQVVPVILLLTQESWLVTLAYTPGAFDWEHNYL